jgi:L-lactate dehydrogenase
MVVGEHGTSEVFLWSGARVGGMSADQAIGGRDLTEMRRAVEPEVRYPTSLLSKGSVRTSWELE